MRFKLLVFIPIVLCLLVAPALADTKPDEGDKSTPPKSASGAVGYKNDFVKGLIEGFEGAFPPPGWAQSVTNPSYTWTTNTLNPFEGAAYAYVPWQVGFPQDERLSFTTTISSASLEDHLVFATAGNTYWATNANFTVEVDGVEVYNFLLEFTAGAFVWDLVSVDLSAWDGQTVTVEFIYAGDDGADQHLDAVQINEGYTPPPPPTNDDCAGAIDLQEQSLITFDVDLCLVNDTFSPGEFGNSCTGYSATGADVVYSIYLRPGESFLASEAGDFDMSMYMVRDCFDPAGTCIVGSDNCCSGAEETVSWVADAAGWYYLIVDGYSGCGVVTVTILQPVNAETRSWGSVKAEF